MLFLIEGGGLVHEDEVQLPLVSRLGGDAERDVAVALVHHGHALHLVAAGKHKLAYRAFGRVFAKDSPGPR